MQGWCNDDKQEGITTEPISKLEIKQENIKVKIGSENKATISITQGGGEYNVSSLNLYIAQTTIENSGTQIEGFQNVGTIIIIWNKDGRFRKLSVSVFMLPTYWN
mgnify:CR=1 FL=1